MPKPDYMPSQADLLRLLELDEMTGTLRWRERPGATAWNARYAGQIVKMAITDDGYRKFELRVRGRRFRVRAHRVVFKMVHGWEPEMVDHRHGVDAGDWPGNLRAAGKTTNRWNSRKRKGRDLPKHVMVSRGVIHVEMKVAGARHQKSGFATVEAAEAYAVALARQLQGDFAPVPSLFD